MTKLGIVSSFNVLCGNAKYSESLAKYMPEKINCIPIEIPNEIQKNHNKNTIENIIRKIDYCDLINIQVEIGLYGPTPKTAANLICKIIKSSKKSSLTMHRVDKKRTHYLRTTYNEFKKNGIISAMRCAVLESVKDKLYAAYKKIINCGVDNHSSFIVHTNREKKRILSINKNANIFVHPIIWPEDLSFNKSINIREKINNENTIIGLFGFITPYKNFIKPTQAILNYGYNVVIAGGTHPESTEYGQKSIHCEFKILDEMILKPSLLENNTIKHCTCRSPLMNERGKFYLKTAPDDKTLLSLIKSVDIVLIPYYETGQSGSGIASLAIQHGKRVIFSDTHLIKELEEFLNKTVNKFDINSDGSLICAIKDTIKENEKTVYFKGYNFQSNIQTYLNSLDIIGE